MKNFIFMGMKHSGKSTQGRLFANKINTLFYDLDDLLEQRYFSQYQSKFNCRQIFQIQGEPFFRNIEIEAAEDFFQNSGKQSSFVLALGGGAADNDQLIQLCKNKAKLVYLELPEEVLLHRILRRGVPPFLDADNPKESFGQYFEKHIQQIIKFADITISVPDQPIEKTAEQVYEILKEYL